MSETSSDTGANSFDWKQDSSKKEMPGPFDQWQQEEYGNALLSSERPSSTTSTYINPTTVTYMKDADRYSKLVHALEKSKQKQDRKIVDELIELVDKSSIYGTPKTGNFYNKF